MAETAGTDSPARSAGEQENFADKSSGNRHAARPAETGNGASTASSARDGEAEQRPILAPISDDFRDREKIPPLVRSGRDAAVAAELFQVLRTFDQDWVAVHSKRVLMITSALRQEGKSFTAINLATSLATPETPVVQVDADCRAPSVHRAFNLTPLAGLSAYLSGRATLDECLQDTHIEGLRVLPAGNSTVGNPEAFAGMRMRRLVDELRALSPAAYILFDAPATLAAPETRILSRHMDAGLLVVAANMTPRKLVEQTLDLLNPMPFCGVVLNRFVLPYSVASKTDYRYGYGYPDGHGNGNRNGGSGRGGRLGLHGLFGS